MSNSNRKEVVTLGGIIKHTNGHGFKITTGNPETANRIKDMIRWILVNDYHYSVLYTCGLYDVWDENGDRKK